MDCEKTGERMSLQCSQASRPKSARSKEAANGDADEEDEEGAAKGAQQQQQQQGEDDAGGEEGEDEEEQPKKRARLERPECRAAGGCQTSALHALIIQACFLGAM